MSALPTFPEFVEVIFDLRDEIERRLDSIELHSDLHFTSLWAWGAGGGVSLLNDDLVLRFRSLATGHNFHSFCGRHDPEATAGAILRHLHDQGMAAELRLIPEEVAIALATRGFVAEACRNDFDYIISTQALATMTGPDWRSQRKSARRFIERNRCRTALLDLGDESTRSGLRALRRGWEARHTSPTAAGTQLWSDTSTADWPAMERLLAAHDRFDLVAIGILVEEELVAIFVGEIVRDGSALGHFLKADHSRFPGATEAMLQEAGREFLQRGCETIDWGSDDGLPRLREMKLRLRPVRFVKKYRISL